MMRATERVLVAVILLTVLQEGFLSDARRYVRRNKGGGLSPLKACQRELVHLKEQKDQVLRHSPLRESRKRSTCGTSRVRTCLDWLATDRRSGIRTVYVYGEPITVYCDQTTDGGGWTVFQRRMDATVDFYRNWTEYVNRFGDLKRNFWLGLDKLHSLTTSQTYELRVDLRMWNGTRGHATYSGFYVEGAGHNFVLRFHNFTGGNAGDGLSYQQGMEFTTKDRDHDLRYGRNCAQACHGAWWYNSCHWSNLNGDYKPSSSAPGSDGLNWIPFGGSTAFSMRFTEMKIRPM